MSRVGWQGASWMMLRRLFREWTYLDSCYSHPSSQTDKAHGKMKRLAFATPRTIQPVSSTIVAIVVNAMGCLFIGRPQLKDCLNRQRYYYCSYFRHLRTIARTTGWTRSRLCLGPTPMCCLIFTCVCYGFPSWASFLTSASHHLNSWLQVGWRQRRRCQWWDQTHS